MPTAQQVEEAFRTVDEMRLDDFAALFTPDGTMTFGNGGPTPDPEGSKQALGGFYSLLRGVRHEVLGAWIVDDVSINESIVHYTMRDGSVVSLPATSILYWRGDRVHEWRIYMDVGPAVAAATASAAS